MPDGTSATKDEVYQAFAALMPGELLKLKQFAIWRMRGLGRACCGRTWEDLLSEAKLSTLRSLSNDGSGRHWSRNVDLVTHLVGAMRSISSHWKRDFDECEADLESEIATVNEEGTSISPLDNSKSLKPSPERVVAGRQEWNLTVTRFSDDPTAIQVLDGLSRGLTTTEIRRDHKLTQWEYQQAVRRIRLRLTNPGEGGGNNDGRKKRC